MDVGFLQWLAGFVDGDGSIWITLRETKTRHSYLAINAGLTISQKSDYRWINEYVQKQLGGIGKIYQSGVYGTAYSKSSWQTTKMAETIYVLELIEPFLVIKKEQAKKVIICLKKWIETCQPVAERWKGKKLRKRSMVMEIVDIATHLNQNMRGGSRYRGYKDFAYWKPLIEQWYPE
jgi:hypothetical protein